MSGSSDARSATAVVRDAIDLARFPWVRPLVTAYARDFASVARLFAGNPAEPSAWRETIARVQRAPRERAPVSDIVSRQLAARAAPAEARAAASRLARPDTVAVVTGQQAGLFGGPLFTLLKAVTAVQLARRVEREYGVPAVALFWVDADDHDWEEIRTVNVLDAALERKAISLAPLEGAGARPVSALVLDQGVETALAELEATLPQTEFTAAVISTLRHHYRPGQLVVTAFAGWLDELVGRHGLIVFESGDRRVKPLVADLFARELAHPCRTSRLAREAGRILSALGHDPQVEPAEESVALFYVDGQGRRPIRCHDEDFLIGDQPCPSARLRAEAEANPERFSPNVLLRPVMQDRLFPTVCYVSGPSELAYQAQLGAVYREFGVEAPLLFPRATATLVDAGAARFLERHQLPLEALRAGDESALNRLLEQQLPPELESAVDETERVLAERTTRLRETVVGLDPTLAGAVDTTVARLRDLFKTLKAKMIQAAKRKDETLRRQFTRTRALAFPDGQPQERAVGLIFFVNRYGLPLADRLVDALPLETDKHYILTP